MGYDAVFRAEAAIKAALVDLAANLTAVAAEHGVTTLPPGEVYDYPLQDWPLGDLRPVEILGPSGPLTGSMQSTLTDLVYWVTISTRTADRPALATQINIDLTALVRTLDNRRAPDGTWRMAVSRVDSSPPLPGRDQTFVGASGVEVTVTIADTR